MKNIYTLYQQKNYRNLNYQICQKKQNLYFTSGKKAYQLNTTDFSAPQNELFEIESDSYGTFYDFEVKDSTVYIADGGNFVSDSYIEIRDLEGEIIEIITVGVGPNGFYFHP